MNFIMHLPRDLEFNGTKQQRWLEENFISFVMVKVVRQAVGFPKGWTCYGPGIKFLHVEDAMAYKLRWI